MRFQIGAFFPTRDMPADHVAIRDRAVLPAFTGPYDVDDSLVFGRRCNEAYAFHWSQTAAQDE